MLNIHDCSPIMLSTQRLLSVVFVLKRLKMKIYEAKRDGKMESGTQKIQKRDVRGSEDKNDFATSGFHLVFGHFYTFLSIDLLGTPDTSLRGLRTLIDRRIFRSTISSDFLLSSVCSISPRRVMYLKWGFYLS